MMEGYTPTDFGVLGVVLIFSWKVIELLARVATSKLNGHVSTPCERAVQDLAEAVNRFMVEDRKSRQAVEEALLSQKRLLLELHKAHLGPAAIDPATGSYRWWQQPKERR